jgi:hypothetical protein
VFKNSLVDHDRTLLIVRLQRCAETDPVGEEAQQPVDPVLPLLALAVFEQFEGDGEVEASFIGLLVLLLLGFGQFLKGTHGPLVVLTRSAAVAKVSSSVGRGINRGRILPRRLPAPRKYVMAAALLSCSGPSQIATCRAREYTLSILATIRLFSEASDWLMQIWSTQYKTGSGAPDLLLLRAGR